MTEKEIIKLAIKKCGTSRVLAEKLKIDVTFMCQINTGKRHIPYTKISAISAITGIPEETILSARLKSKLKH